MAKTKVTITINGQETNLNSIKNAYTHAGVFHADEVCTTALLFILGYEGNINRIFNNEVPDLPEGSFIFDRWRKIKYSQPRCSTMSWY